MDEGGLKRSDSIMHIYQKHSTEGWSEATASATSNISLPRFAPRHPSSQVGVGHLLAGHAQRR